MTDQPTTQQLATLGRARRALREGRHWWIDNSYAQRPDYAYAIAALEADGHPVHLGRVEVRVDPTPEPHS